MPTDERSMPNDADRPIYTSRADGVLMPLTLNACLVGAMFLFYRGHWVWAVVLVLIAVPGGFLHATAWDYVLYRIKLAVWNRKQKRQQHT